MNRVYRLAIATAGVVAVTSFAFAWPHIFTTAEASGKTCSCANMSCSCCGASCSCGHKASALGSSDNLLGVAGAQPSQQSVLAQLNQALANHDTDSAILTVDAGIAGVAKDIPLRQS